MISAGLAHAGLLAAMHEQAFPRDPWDAASFAALLAMPGVAGLIDERGGFLLLRMVLDEAEILTIGVTAPRQGIGLALMREGLRLAAIGGVREMHLEVAAANAAARALYTRLGFTQTGLRRAYYPDGGDALTLHLVLA
ncbi:GNAT family N-acetyltransferase [Acidocella sp. KAb 2-4]|uniref:GNAT family N-acetyltransferase n=1 Tax=Acidocella sp. KAb 2-4 TaxID=2885158 RepID=UPI001D07CFFA|nr:GNAT family N-acetyltransferase [Acidocella sp. KAb 2-4]MCB5945715.1 GNAT family N-acetyltransferase [Acidocella sp. KAb 2-4]